MFNMYFTCDTVRRVGHMNVKHPATKCTTHTPSQTWTYCLRLNQVQHNKLVKCNNQNNSCLNIVSFTDTYIYIYIILTEQSWWNNSSNISNWFCFAESCIFKSTYKTNNASHQVHAFWLTLHILHMLSYFKFDKRLFPNSNHIYLQNNNSLSLLQYSQ